MAGVSVQPFYQGLGFDLLAYRKRVDADQSDAVSTSD